ncbi:MAG: hypothetical protein BroJett011_03900 [Chloroflexota bacterium]|nr:MAG: hypothetical protein BroJett011_03900 [Chloroflexota bacterium]
MPVDFNLELRLAYLRAAQSAQQEEEDKIITYRAFFEGDQGVELTDRQKEYLSDPKSFGNVCKRVVGIVKDRLSLSEAGISAADTAGQRYAEAVTGWWSVGELNSKQKEIYEASLRDTSVALIVGWDTVNSRPTFTPNLIYDGETGLIRFHYDSDNNLLFASKRWTVWNPLKPGETGKRRLTVYRPGAIERYEADEKVPGGWRFLQPAELADAENPQGLPNPQPWTDTGDASGQPLPIPVIPFENPGGSELADVVTIQQLLNHGLGTFDIATDFHGLPILWFHNAEFPVDEETGEETIPEFGPGTAINMKGDSAGAGRIEPADLVKLFQAGVLSWVQVLALVKGWPMFLFDRAQQAPSGIALQIMEGGLVSQVEDKQIVFGGAWRKAFDVARQLHRRYTGEELPGELKLTWKSAKTADEQGEIETKARKFEAGEIPTEQRWEELGYTVEQIAKMKAMKAEAVQQQQALMQRQQEQAQQQQNDSQPTPGESQGE